MILLISVRWTPLRSALLTFSYLLPLPRVSTFETFVFHLFLADSI